MSERTPSWGIEPVPERLRSLGALDNAMLWSSLGLSLLVLVAGTVLVPALSLRSALLAIVVGGVFGNALLGAAAAIGADARVPAMVLLRAPLGRHGSWLPTALNVLQNVGWTIFEVLVIATAARALVHGPLWIWKLAAAAAATALALVGPIGFVREWVRRFALWVVLASLAYLTWWVLHDAHLGALWSQPGKGGFPSFWQGVDLMVAMPVSWLPLAADYTRFSRDRRGAFWGTALGYLVRTSGSTASARSCCSRAGSPTPRR
jgi:NCS1 family nucleobase:cation symporter-1